MASITLIKRGTDAVTLEWFVAVCFLWSALKVALFTKLAPARPKENKQEADKSLVEVGRKAREQATEIYWDMKSSTDYGWTRKRLSRVALPMDRSNTTQSPEEESWQRFQRWRYDTRLKLNICTSSWHSDRLNFAVMIAEVVRHFFPRMVDLHNYSPANSKGPKVVNWQTLNRKWYWYMVYAITCSSFLARLLWLFMLKAQQPLVAVIWLIFKKSGFLCASAWKWTFDLIFFLSVTSSCPREILLKVLFITLSVASLKDLVCPLGNVENMACHFS